MRITNNVLSNNMLRNMSKNMIKMDRLQNQLSTGKRINVPSDDPTGMVTSLKTRSKLHENEQFKENVTQAFSWLERTDSALDSLNSTLQRARELVVRGATGSNSDGARKAIAEEIDQLKEEVADIANTKLGERYIFGGTQTMNKVYEEGRIPEEWIGNSEYIKFEVGEGVTASININGRSVFGKDPDPANSIFSTLDKISQDLRDGNLTSLSEGDLEQLDEHIDIVLNYRAEVGARINRLEMVENRLDEVEINLTKVLSENEDADMAKLIIDIKNQENVYRAALAAGARIIQPTLVDFLR